MTEFPLSVILGLIAGFVGAIPPGPLNVTVIRKASTGDERGALRVALGGSLVDSLICGAVGLGFGWILERVVTNRWVRGTLALFLLAYGLKLLVFDRTREGGPPAEAPRARLPFLTGLLQGAANPTVVVNWTLLIGFLIGHRLLHSTAASASGFALGVGAGVFLWFLLLIELVEKLRNHPAGEFLHRSTLVAGLLLFGFGVYFTWVSLRELL